MAELPPRACQPARKQAKQRAMAAIRGPPLSHSRERRSMPRFRTLWLAIAALLLAPFAVSPASAQTYPSQTVRIIVPFSAGSVTDIKARVVADEIGRQWGQQVIVEHPPVLAGTSALPQAKPGGYTLTLT